MNVDELKIAVLAISIRDNWREIGDRLDKIISLCYKIGRQDLVDEIDENRDDIYNDGRWFRDSWSGPYGYPTVETYPLVRKIYDKYICYYYDIEYYDDMYNYRPPT